MVFAMANWLLVYHDRELHCIGNLIEGEPQFPDTYTRDTAVWAVALAVSDSSAFVLARGQTSLERQLLDEYSTRTCQYLRTLRLPRRLQAMAHDGGVFYFYYEDPAPGILALRQATR